MSSYGPALFIIRKDNHEISASEQQLLHAEVVTISQQIEMLDDEGNPVEPLFYDYNGYEENGVSFIFYASLAYAMMPEEVQQDQQQADEIEIEKIVRELESRFPGKYCYKTYYVER